MNAQLWPASGDGQYSLIGRVSGRPEYAPARGRSAWRSRAPGLAFSVGLHLACAIGGLSLARGEAVDRVSPAMRSLTFAMLVPALPSTNLTPPRATPRPPVVAHLPPTPTMPTPAPIPVTPPEADEGLTPDTPAPMSPVPAAELAVEAPLPDSFRDATVAATVQQAPERSVHTGAFERAVSERARSGDRDLAPVAPAGFGRADARPMAHAVNASVVGPVGFDRATATAPPVTPGPRTDAFDTPVEILFKPKPLYTDEAQALRIEGTVVLDVEFGESNEVRVVRVIRSLGHGLDEAAARAAEQIRFKPARRQGAPVGCRLTVQIEFRLT